MSLNRVQEIVLADMERLAERVGFQQAPVNFPETHAALAQLANAYTAAEMLRIQELGMKEIADRRRHARRWKRRNEGSS